MYFKRILLVKCVFLLVAFVGIFATIYQMKKKAINRIYYLFVIILLVFTPVFLFDDIVPEFKDLENLQSKTYSTYTGYCDSISLGIIKEVKFGNEFYEYNPWEFDPQVGKEYKIYYLPNSQYIVEYEMQ